MARSALLILFLLLTLGASLILVFRPAIFYQRAAGSSSTLPNLQNSYLFASPLQAKANGIEQIRVTVFLLDSRGMGISQQTVELIRPQSLTLVNSQSVTDDTGKAVFDLSSTTPLSHSLSARVNGQDLPQKVKVVFY